MVVLPFLVATFAVSWAIEAAIVRSGPVADSPLGALLVWVPGLVAIALTRLRRTGPRPLRLVRPGWRDLAVAAAIPGAAVFAAAVLLVVSGTDTVRVGLPGAGRILLAVLFSLGLFLFAALGEELGWRGYLLSALRASGVPAPGLLVGAVWATWHFPLILFGDYATSPTPVASAAIFFVDLTAFGWLLARLTSRSGSLAPAVLAHAVHNVLVLGVTPLFLVPGPRHPYLAGESGLFLAAAYLIIAAGTAARDRALAARASASGTRTPGGSSSRRRAGS